MATFLYDLTTFVACCSFIAGEEPGSMADVSYYSYDYDPEIAFLPESEEKLVPIREEEEAGDTVGPVNEHLLTVDTKDSPERW